MKIVLTAVLLAAVATGGWFGVQAFAGPPSEPASEAALASDSLSADSAQTAFGPLSDEVAALNARLATAEAAADSLRQLLDEQSTLAAAARTDAAELATTLAKMEDADLASVVQRLDGRSFVQLYEAASSRNQVRLLGSLTSEQAAQFIRHQLPGGATRSVSHRAADSLATS